MGFKFSDITNLVSVLLQQKNTFELIVCDNSEINLGLNRYGTLEVVKD